MKKSFVAILSITVITVMLVIAVTVVTAMDVKTEITDVGSTNDLTEESVDIANDPTEETEDVTASLDRGDNSIVIIDYAATDYMELIGEAYDVVLGEIIDSGEAIMTSPNCEPLDENGKSNMLQKPYNIKVIQSYKRNIKEGRSVSVVTNTIAMNGASINRQILKNANAKDSYLPGTQYLFVLSADTEVIDRWGKNAYYLAHIPIESIFEPGADGKFHSLSFEVDLNAIADDIISAEKYISERSDYNEIQADISARKAAE